MTNQPQTPEEMARRAYLADLISDAQDEVSSERRAREAELERFRQQEMDAATKRFRAVIEPHIHPNIRDALQWRYDPRLEPDEDGGEEWRGAACVEFHGVSLRLSLAPNSSDRGDPTYLRHIVVRTSQRPAWGPHPASHTSRANANSGQELADILVNAHTDKELAVILTGPNFQRDLLIALGELAAELATYDAEEARDREA